MEHELCIEPPIQLVGPLGLSIAPEHAAQVDVPLVGNPIQGMPGPPGPPGGSQLVAMQAGEALGGQRVVVARNGKAFHASAADLGHADLVLGVTTGAAVSGASVEVLAQGEMTEAAWAWTLNTPIFLGTNGLMTQTPPASGVWVVVAVPITPTRIAIGIKNSVLL